MVRVPKAAEPLIAAFSVAFTRPTFQRVVVLILGAILSLRHRTVTGMLRGRCPFEVVYACGRYSLCVVSVGLGEGWGAWRPINFH
jgi:hypothetical protein